MTASSKSTDALDAKDPGLLAEKPVVALTAFEDNASGNILAEVRGEKQHLSKLALLGMSFAILNTWAASSISIYIGLADGGSTSVIYGMIAATLCSFCVAASLSELCHVFPTAGAQYHWQFALSHASSTMGRLGTYIAGFFGASGWIVLSAAGPALVGSYVEACISLFHPTYAPTNWVRFVIYMGLTAYSTFVCICGAKIIDTMNRTAMFSSLTGAVVVFVVLLACSGAHDSLRDGKWVFATFTNETGWSDGVCWILGLLNAQFSLVGADAAAHLVNEVPNPSMNAPLAMVVSCLMGGASAVVVLIAFLAAVTDVRGAVEAGGGAFLLIIWQAVEHKAGAIIVSLFVIATMIFTIPAINLTANHMVQALGRDQVLPGGKWLGSTSAYWEMPVGAALFNLFWFIVIGCLEFGPSQLLVATQSSSVVLLQLSYLPCIAAMLFWGRKRMDALGLSRRWSFGLYGGIAVNVVAIAYQVLTIVFFLFPSTPIKTVNGVSNIGEMNWAVAVVGIVLILAVINWFAWSRTRYHGPTEFLSGNVHLRGLYQ